MRILKLNTNYNISVSTVNGLIVEYFNNRNAVRTATPMPFGEQVITEANTKQCTLIDLGKEIVLVNG